jgi:hypothetical protein
VIDRYPEAGTVEPDTADITADLPEARRLVVRLWPGEAVD